MVVLHQTEAHNIQIDSAGGRCMNTMDFSRHTTKDIAGYTKLVHDLKWNQEGNYIGMVSADKTVKVGQLDKSGAFQNVHSIPSSAQIAQIHWNPQDDSRIGMCGDDKAVELWDVRASRASVKLSSAGSNLSIAWSPCGSYLAVGNKSDVVTVFDVRTNAVCKKKKFPYEVNDLVWTANPNFLLAATGGDGVGALDVLSLGLSQDSSACECSSAALVAAPSQKSAAAPEELQLVDSVGAHVSNCLTLRVDPGYRRLAAGSLDNCVSFWELDDLVCTHTLSFESEVHSMSYSGDGRFLAVACEDPVVTICDTQSGEALARVPSRQKVNAVAWHPKQSLLCVAADDRSASPQFLRFVCFA